MLAYYMLLCVLFTSGSLVTEYLLLPQLTYLLVEQIYRKKKGGDLQYY